MFGAVSEELVRNLKDLKRSAAVAMDHQKGPGFGEAWDDTVCVTPSSGSRSPAYPADEKPPTMKTQAPVPDAVAEPAVEMPLRAPTGPQYVPLIAGGFAGMTAEAVLFPLDCLKTRVQSRHGFWKSGGFQGMYRGVGTAVAGSAPASAIFFTTYELTKSSLNPYSEGLEMRHHVSIGVLASVLGELAAGVIRVPVDLMKQRQQAGQGGTFREIFHGARNTQSAIFVASFQASALRDIMHSSLQFPMYECLKTGAARWGGFGTSEFLPTSQAAMCGGVAGAVSAVLTTPLDLLRTRLNLRDSVPLVSKQRSRSLLSEEVRHIYSTDGLKGFFRGGACRATWMGLGGFIFLGSFELAKNNLRDGDASWQRNNQLQAQATTGADARAEAKRAPASAADGPAEPSGSWAWSRPPRSPSPPASSPASPWTCPCTRWTP